MVSFLFFFLCGDLAPPSVCVGQWLAIMFQRLTVRNVSESHTETFTAMAHHHKPPPEAAQGPGTGRWLQEERLLLGHWYPPQMPPTLWTPDGFF